MRFSSTDHPQYEVRGVIEREHMATPLVSYLGFPCASEFEANNLDVSVTPNLVTEKFAKTALCLFVPFRDEEQFQPSQQTCYAFMLQAAVNANAITGESLVCLQNIQNCHNMMRAGRQKGITVPLPDPVKEGQRL